MTPEQLQSIRRYAEEHRLIGIHDALALLVEVERLKVTIDEQIKAEERNLIGMLDALALLAEVERLKVTIDEQTKKLLDAGGVAPSG